MVTWRGDILERVESNQVKVRLPGINPIFLGPRGYKIRLRTATGKVMSAYDMLQIAYDHTVRYRYLGFEVKNEI